MILFKQKESNRCFTYFRIAGDFNPDDVTGKLGLTPFEFWKIGDKRKNGSTFDFAAWHFGKCDVYNIDVNEQMKVTIEPLLDKIGILNQIKEENDVGFYIEVVPYLYPDNDTPCLAPSLEVMDFCTATRTEIDIDLYIE